MAKVKFMLGIGFPGATVTNVVNVPDWEDLSDDEKYEELNEWANNYIDMGFEEVE
jgi:hypothetical protein